MPFIKRVVTPHYVSRTSSKEQSSVLTKDNSELVAVNNATLSNAIRQLACLAGHAEEIFAELRLELGEVNARATSLKEKICQLEGVTGKLDARTVTVPESDLDSFYRRTDHFKSKQHLSTGLFNATTRTPAIQQLYEKAGATPVPAMRQLDRLRRDGRRASKIFMCTPVLGGTGPRHKRRLKLAEIETSKPAVLTSLRPWKSSEVLSDTTIPPDVSSAPLVDTTVCPEPHQLPSPEEMWSVVARRFPGHVVAVDTSGRNFDRQQRNRRSLSQEDARRAQHRHHHRKRRSRRRNTIAGTSEGELIRQAADGESQPGSGDADSPEVESSVQSLAAKRKGSSPDKAMGERVMSHLNSLRQWGRQRLSRSATRNSKDEHNIYESIRSRRSHSSSPVSVRMRSNSSRKKEDNAGHSSSGNWSATSSARTSVESDQHRGSSCTSSHTASIPVSSSSNSLGRDSAVSVRRPKALSISSTISRTSESGTLTPELLHPNDIHFTDSVSSSCNDGETSSVYSCDTEGYYTSFHMDSGLKTLREEPTESSSNTANTTGSGNTTVCAQIVTKALSAECEYELFGKGSTSTTASSAGTVCTTLLAAGKPSPPPRKSSLELVANKSDSNSDNDTIERRLRVKTALSSSRIPSMCVITPPPSDDESMRPHSRSSYHTLPRSADKSPPVTKLSAADSVDKIHWSAALMQSITKVKTPPPPEVPKNKLNEVPKSSLPQQIVGKMKEVLRITHKSDEEYVSVSEGPKQPKRCPDLEYVSLNELRPTSPADSGSGSNGSSKSPQSSLERRRRQGARVTLDSEGKVVYSSDSLKRKPKSSNATFEPGPYVKTEASPSPLPLRSTTVRAVTRTSPPMSPTSASRVIIRAAGNKVSTTTPPPRTTVRATAGGPTSPKPVHPGAYVDMQASQKQVLQGKKENISNLAPFIIAALSQEKQETTENFIDPSSQELNKVKRNESYRLAANISPVLHSKQQRDFHNHGEVKKNKPSRILEEKTQQQIAVNPNVLGRRFYGAQIMVDPNKMIPSKVSSYRPNDIQEQLLATQISASSPKSRVIVPSDTEKARVLNSDMSSRRYYHAAPPQGSLSHQQPPPPPAPYYWTLPSRRPAGPTTAEHLDSWYHTIASHKIPPPEPAPSSRSFDTNHNVLQNQQMFSTPTKNHHPQLPNCSYSPIGSPKKIITELNKPLLSPPRSTMSADELFTAIHRSKRRMNIKTSDDFSRSTSPTTSSASLSPGSSESSLGAAGNRHSWSPCSTELLPDFVRPSKEQQNNSSPNRQRQSWAGDRLGPSQATSRNVFKRLLLEKGSRNEGKGRISAVEQLMASKSTAMKPKEQKVMLPSIPSGLRSPASWRFNSPRSDVLSSTILEDTEEVSDHSRSYSPRHSFHSPQLPRYDMGRTSNLHSTKFLRNASSNNAGDSYNRSNNISPYKLPLHNNYNNSPQLVPAVASSPVRVARAMQENNLQNSPPSPSKISLETAL